MIIKDDNRVKEKHEYDNNLEYLIILYYLLVEVTFYVIFLRKTNETVQAYSESSSQVFYQIVYFNL